MDGLILYRPWDPTTYPAGIEARAPDVLATWLRHFPDSRPKRRDGDDWIENAILLHTADLLGLDVTILPDGEGTILVSGSNSVPPPSPAGATPGNMLGIWTKRDFLSGLPVDVDLVGTNAHSVGIANRYWASPVFLRHAGRLVIPVDGDVEGDRGIEAGLRRIADAGGDRVFLKTAAKGMSGIFPLVAKGSLWRGVCAHDALLEDDGGGYGLEWIPVQHEGSRDHLLLQQVMPCRFEYRMQVIDGSPVTGAGCIEAFTPVENAGDVFDAQMEEIRSDGDVVAMPELRDRYLAFAHRFCAEWAAEHGDGLDYGLDLCLDETGEVRVIELNQNTNLGLYACDMTAKLKAVADRLAGVCLRRAA